VARIQCKKRCSVGGFNEIRGAPFYLKKILIFFALVVGFLQRCRNLQEKKQHPRSSCKKGVKPKKSDNKKGVKSEKSDKKKGARLKNEVAIFSVC
jgi:hypothetical protein